MICYAQVMRQAPLANTAWDGANHATGDSPAWPPASGAPAFTWDQGFSDAATAFRVTGLRLWLGAAGVGPVADFACRLWAPGTYPPPTPAATPVAVIELAGQGWNPVGVPVPVNVVNGAGILGH